MDSILRLILENIWLIVFIIIGLSQFFTAMRAEKNRPPDFSDSQQPPDMDELIRRIQEQERQQTPPPLPTQTPRPQPQKNKIPHASKPHPDTLSSATQQKGNTATDPFTSDAYSLSAPPLPATSRPSSAERALQEISHELEHVRKQAEAYELKATGKLKPAQKILARQTWRQLLQNPTSTRQAIILSEILGTPRAYRAYNFSISATPFA